MLKDLDIHVSPLRAKSEFDTSYILSLILDIGEEMLTCGAEINRVEDSIYRMLTSYGYRKVNVFSIPEYISVSIVDHSGEIITQSRRIYKFSNDFYRLEQLNDLSRRICAKKPNVAELWSHLETVESVPYAKSTSTFAFAHFLGGSCFCIFLGGDLGDGFAAGCVALIFLIMGRISRVQNLNKIFYTALSALLGGLAAIIFGYIGIGQHVDKIMIGDIMLLIPGMALTTSIRDMLCGDLMAGLFRALESIMVAGAIALGYAIPIYLLGGML
ncbi:MAG: threonine/serine exporter family protein [Lachnospiraceae bacterium]|jgi:uncharacterized membrane protein YjjP (DUF1212 family)|nr:threonine/serine exporter family protein [Lachnospiraceae bacterium]